MTVEQAAVGLLDVLQQDGEVPLREQMWETRHSVSELLVLGRRVRAIFTDVQNDAVVFVPPEDGDFFLQRFALVVDAGQQDAVSDKTLDQNLADHCEKTL